MDRLMHSHVTGLVTAGLCRSLTCGVYLTFVCKDCFCWIFDNNLQNASVVFMYHGDNSLKQLEMRTLYMTVADIHMKQLHLSFRFCLKCYCQEQNGWVTKNNIVHNFILDCF